MVYRALWMTCYVEGQYQDARAHLEQSLACYHPDTDRGMVWVRCDIALITVVWLAIVLWPLGEIGRACRPVDDLLVRANLTGHVPTLVYSCSMSCVGVRAHLAPFYSATGRPSIDPEL
jgi:hypothetical protein